MYTILNLYYDRFREKLRNILLKVKRKTLKLLVSCSEHYAGCEFLFNNLFSFQLNEANKNLNEILDCLTKLMSFILLPGKTA